MNARALRHAAGTLVALAVVAGIIAVPFLSGNAAAPQAGGAATAPPPEMPVATPAPVVERLVPPAKGVYLGVSSPTLPRRPGAIGEWTRDHGVPPRIVGWYQQWLSGERRFRADWARRVAAAGAVPLVTWEPWYAPAGEIHSPDQPAISLARIAAGDHDAIVRRFAREIAAYGGPVLLRPMHEMNGDWYPWGILANGNSAPDYVRAWRRIHGIFTAEGARNVSWVWSVNNLEGPAEEDRAIDDYYPGRRYVDWVSTSGFNWGDAYVWSSWRDADALYGATYRALARFGRPIMISEMGTTDIGGDPRSWIVTTLARLRTGYPLLRAVVWYDDVDADGLDFRLRGPTARLLADRAATGRGWLRDLEVRAFPR